VVHHEADAGPAQCRRCLDQLVLLTVDLQEPPHLPDPGQQPIGAWLHELAHAVGGEIEADPDHAPIGQRAQGMVGDVRARQGDALQPSLAGGEAVQQTTVVGAVGPGADQQAVRQPVGLEHREELCRRARLARMGLVHDIRRVRIGAAAEHVGVAIGRAGPKLTARHALEGPDRDDVEGSHEPVLRRVATAARACQGRAAAGGSSARCRRLSATGPCSKVVETTA
jgi:hypothetical protein